MTPYAQLEKSAYRGRALAQGAVAGLEALRGLLTRNRSFGKGVTTKLQGLADKIPGKQIGTSVLDPEVISASKWRAAGAGALGGAIGGVGGVGLSKALRELGIYKNLGWEKDQPAQAGEQAQGPKWVANAKPLHMR